MVLKYGRASDVRGNKAQKELVSALLQMGRGPVVSLFTNVDVVPETHAPVIRNKGNDLLISPDVLYWVRRDLLQEAWGEIPYTNSRLLPFFAESKGKEKPTWRREPPGPRWEHGIDFSIFQEYQRVQEYTGVPVLVFVKEDQSPANPSAESATTGPIRWFVLSLDHMAQVGDHRKEWPGGQYSDDLGRKSKGGWLWARNDMVSCSGT